MASAEQAAKGGRVHALTITDNPGGNPAISAEMLANELKQLDIEPLVHLACKDKSRNQLESLLHGLERASVCNLLALTGDYSCVGYKGSSKPVFDLDASQLLRLVADLNKGLVILTSSGSQSLAPTRFLAGGVVSPFKALEAEVMGQYYKLLKKLSAGAQFIVTQLGYDARKFHEVLLMMRCLGFAHIPVIGNVYVLSRGAAQLMHRGEVPGCVVTDELLSLIVEEARAKDKGKARRLDRAAKMYAFMKGMGFSGVHIGGHGLRHEDIVFIIERGEDLVGNWHDLIPEFDFPQAGGWYCFEKDIETGLNTDVAAGRSRARPSVPLSYKSFRLLHAAMFDERGVLFGPMRAVAQAIDGSALEHAFTRVEHIIKVITNECLQCGDCGLPDVAYICPTSQCPKELRNGPCGGSFEGWCEVYPSDKQCIYVRAYSRLKRYGEEGSLAACQVPPVDYRLRHTSSWLNYYMGRDHAATRVMIESPSRKDDGDFGR
jgi:methylenetetrahydrofolate reductase (NADPH)